MEADDGQFEAEEETSHPLLQKAIDLLEQIATTFPEDGPRSSPSLTLIYQGAAEVLGGLAQSLSDPEPDPESCGLRIAQLKRALRGAAFARGALLPLRSTISSEPFEELFRRFSGWRPTSFPSSATSDPSTGETTADVALPAKGTRYSLLDCRSSILIPGFLAGTGG